jgi:hypothetical protein
MTLRFDVGLELPGLADAHPIRTTLSSLVRRRVGERPKGTPSGGAHWGAKHFGLHEARLYRGATEAQRLAILERCGRALLEEAYFIEKAGVAYAAKMILLAESSHERQLYGLFAGDEAVHLEMIGRYIDPESAPSDPFVRLLGELIERGDRAVLQLLIQIVLEGWGIVHYRGLRDACQDPELARVLAAILRDEAAHHQSGVILFNEREPDRASWTFITEAMAAVLRMVQAGPQAVVAAVEQVLGHLRPDQKLELLAELGARAHCAERLSTLEALMAKAEGAAPVLATLEARGLFEPLAAKELV